MFGFGKPKPVLPPGLIHTINENNKWTWDIGELEQSQFHTIFVCDDMQIGHRHHSLIGDYGVCLGVGFTAQPYTMIKSKLGLASEGVVLRRQYASSPFTVVKGEIWQVEPKAFIGLDKHKQNGVRFKRRKTVLLVPYRMSTLSGSNEERHVHPVTAWMYFGKPKYWESQLDGGYLFGNVRTFHPNTHPLGIRNYYQFTKKEYNT